MPPRKAPRPATDKAVRGPRTTVQAGGPNCREANPPTPPTNGVGSQCSDSLKLDGNGSGSGQARLNRVDTERFLKALDRNASFTFQTFDDNVERSKARGARPFVRILHGTLAQHWNELAKLNAQGAGIFVTVNATNLKGRRAEDVVRVRALFVDLDGAPLPSTGPRPHIIVETSPGHWHAYWLVDDVKLEEFSDKQRTLIALHSGDPAVCDLPRVMRLPGFYHRKREPRMVRVLDVFDAAPYASADFPIIAPTTAPSATRRPNAALTADDGRVARAVAFIPNDGGWKEWCDLGLAIFAATGGSEGGFTIFHAWSARSPKYDIQNTTATWDGFKRSPPGRIGFGTIYHTATKASPRWADRLDDGDPDARAVVAAFLEVM
jgi:hypothetical protein